MIDYHIHTRYCGHAVEEPEAYAVTALDKGIEEIGFSDHLPMIKYAQPGLAMGLAELPLYINSIHELQRNYPEITIRLGGEADYFTRKEERELKDLLGQGPFDYILGSVHYIGSWAFDWEENVNEWEKRDVNVVYKQYFELLQQAASSKLFDIMSHIDLVKKFGYKPTENLSKHWEETIQIFRKYGLAVEINTSGLRRPAGEIYPSLPIVKLLKKYDIPIVFGSDAHNPNQLAADFMMAGGLVREQGYREVVVFSKRRIIRTHPI
jgi:histidinol-phosphatase (PHP family)